MYTPPQTVSLRHDHSLSALSAGLLAVFTGYAGSLILIIQAAQAAGLNAAQTTSWVWAVSVGMGLGSLLMSLHYRLPLLLVWSTPGAALLAVNLPGIAFAEAVGAYLVSGLLVILSALFTPLTRLARRLPSTLAAALLAGILFQLGTQVFLAGAADSWLVLPMLAVWLLCSHWTPRLAIPLALLTGLLIAGQQGRLELGSIDWQLAQPVWQTPQFSVQALFSLALPLYLLAMTAQNLPGLAVLQTDGYRPPVRGVLLGSGLMSLLLAPFGNHGMTLAAITAALCTGEQTHADPRRRYMACVWAGVACLAIALFAGSLGSLLLHLPGSLISTLAGLALLGTIGSGLSQAMHNSEQRHAALLTFMVTASGVSAGGLAAPCWGLLVGLLWLGLQRLRQRQLLRQ